jgi:DNA-binding XRE family transcriptional regulator
MKAQLQTLKLAGKSFVVLEQNEYERLRSLELRAEQNDLPPWPLADSKGNRPALEFIRVSIARDIITERRALGLTQEELARLAGVRQETLSRLETGKHSPNVRTVDKIDRALKQASRRMEKARSRPSSRTKPSGKK